MTKITLDKEGQILLPESFRNQHPLEPGTEMFLESFERGLSLYFVRPDVQRAYIEVTSRCNLSCAMCVRQSWLDPLGRMSARTFQAVLHGFHCSHAKVFYIGWFILI